MNAAIVAFYKNSQSYLDNKPTTQRTDRNILEAFRAKHDDSRSRCSSGHIEKVLAEKAGKPGAQRNLLRVLRVLLAFCVKQEWRKDNPAIGIEVNYKGGKGFHSGPMPRLHSSRHGIQ